MKIVITNGYTWNNSGDAGIVIGTIELLKQVFGENTEFTVFTGTPELDREKYAINGIKAQFMNRMLVQGKKYLGFIPYNSYCLLFQVLFSNLKLLFAKKYLNKNRENYRALKEADLIVVCGGGYLGGDAFWGNLNHLHQIKINSSYKKRMIVLGASVEPTTKWYIRRMLKNTLKKVDRFYSREYVTTDFLQKDLELCNVVEMPDMAFFFEKTDTPVNVREKFNIEKKRIVVGITMRDCFRKKEYAAFKSDYVNAMRKILSGLIREYQCFVCCIPFCRNQGDDDREITEYVIDGLEEKMKERVAVLDGDFAPGQLKDILGQMDYFVGTRMHSNIFAMSVGVPTTAIKYEEKTQGIMTMLGMETSIFDAYHLDAEGVLKNVGEHMKNREEISKTLKEKVERFKVQIVEEMRNLVAEK